MADKDLELEDLSVITTSRDYKHAHLELVKRYKRLEQLFEKAHPGKKLLVTCTYRSPEEQRRLFCIGRFGDKVNKPVTYLDGKNKRSKHNVFPSRALDVAVIVCGKVAWDEALYYPIGPLAREVGLDWGGFWTTFQDFVHLQLPKDVT